MKCWLIGRFIRELEENKVKNNHWFTKVVAVAYQSFYYWTDFKWQFKPVFAMMVAYESGRKESFDCIVSFVCVSLKKIRWMNKIAFFLPTNLISSMQSFFFRKILITPLLVTTGRCFVITKRDSWSYSCGPSRNVNCITLRAASSKNQAKSQFRGRSWKINFFRILHIIRYW